MSKNIKPQPLKGLPLVEERFVSDVNGVEPSMGLNPDILNHYCTS